MRKARIYDARQLPAYLSPAQYAALMGVNLKTVQKMCRTGDCLPKRWGCGCGALTRMRRWSRGRWTEQTKSPPVQRTPASLQGDSFEPTITRSLTRNRRKHK